MESHERGGGQSMRPHQSFDFSRSAKASPDTGSKKSGLKIFRDDVPVSCHDRDLADCPNPPSVSPPRNVWKVRTPTGAPAARLSMTTPGGRSLSSAAWALLIALEGWCRTKPYCWVGDEALAAEHGSTTRNVRRHLHLLEECGVILRVGPVGRKLVRFGIILLKRIDLDLPVATAEDIPEIAEFLRARWVASHPRSKHGRPADLKRTSRTDSSGSRTLFNTSRTPFTDVPGTQASKANRTETSYGIRTNLEENKESSEIRVRDDDVSISLGEQKTLPSPSESTSAVPSRKPQAVLTPADLPLEPLTPKANPSKLAIASAAAVEAARLCFGEEVAKQVQAAAASIDRALGGRWDCYEAAVFMAKVADKKKKVETPLGYFWRLGVQNYLINGVPPDIEKVKTERLKEARKAKQDAFWGPLREVIGRIDASVFLASLRKRDIDLVVMPGGKLRAVRLGDQSLKSVFNEIPSDIGYYVSHDLNRDLLELLSPGISDQLPSATPPALVASALTEPVEPQTPLTSVKLKDLCENFGTLPAASNVRPRNATPPTPVAKQLENLDSIRRSQEPVDALRRITLTSGPAKAIATALGDPYGQYFGVIERVCERLLAGDVPLEVVTKAYQDAKSMDGLVTRKRNDKVASFLEAIA
jgi:hypothetical protein